MDILQQVSSTGWTLLSFIVVLSILVFVHEWGHYWVAKKAGVRIEAFSIGFGPEIFGFTDKAGTRWKFAAVPLGGYVKMFGEAQTGFDEVTKEERELTAEERSVSFYHKSLTARSAIVFGGPLANFIFAAIVVAIVGMAVGTAKPLATVGTVVDGSAAATAGFRSGDRIVAIDGDDITWFSELSERVSAKPGETVRFEVDRDGAILTLDAIPTPVETGDGAIGRLGVGVDQGAIVYERMGPFEAVWAGVEYTVGLSWRILQVLGELIVGDRSIKELGGPVKIAQISGEVTQTGWLQTVMLMAALSVNLGLINLFPIPILDGGRLMFYAYEAVAGKPMNETAEEYGMRIGLGLVLVLVVVITWNDIVSIIQS